ncbi:MAG: hypothetical protein AB8U16_01105 [Rickettsiales endosymbiont of Dermacentor nuttalli]
MTRTILNNLGNKIGPKDKQNALFLAARSGNIEIVDALLSRTGIHILKNYEIIYLLEL